MQALQTFRRVRQDYDTVVLDAFGNDLSSAGFAPGVFMGFQSYAKKGYHHGPVFRERLSSSAIGLFLTEHDATNNLAGIEFLLNGNELEILQVKGTRGVKLPFPAWIDVLVSAAHTWGFSRGADSARIVDPSHSDWFRNPWPYDSRYRSNSPAVQAHLKSFYRMVAVRHGYSPVNSCLSSSDFVRRLP